MEGYEAIFRQVFGGDYIGYTQFLDKVLKPVLLQVEDGEENYEKNDYELTCDKETKEKARKVNIEKILCFGNFKLGDGTLTLFDVTMNDKAKLLHSRVRIQHIIKGYIANTDGAIIIFHYKEVKDRPWRLSYLEKGRRNDNSTPPKRYTYILKKGLPTNTITARFLTLLQKNLEKDLYIYTLTEAFSVEPLTKEFYDKLFTWYDNEAVNMAAFPAGRNKSVRFIRGGAKESKEDDRTIREHLIRLITRIMFLWFLKQKWSKFNWVFSESEVKTILKKGVDLHSTEDGTYYNAILQNLFFATLNRPIIDKDTKEKLRSFSGQGGNNKDNDFGVKTKYRDDKEESFFSVPQEEVIKHFENIPYLNGGLFECLDKMDDIGGKVEYKDGFSREKSRRAFLPNALFFGSGESEYSDRCKIKGLYSIFNEYNWTVEENTPQDIDVALDPELLGKVFENLLASFNPETNESARKDSGSYYTPREIVSYMVDRAVKEYLKSKLKRSDKDEETIDKCLDSLFLEDEEKEENKFNLEEKEKLVKAINSIKVLDPACGSGAFPMGVLIRLTFLLKKLKEGDKEEGGQDKTRSEEYKRKLYLIENCIYGVDIQSIAMQITKLRFFISLIIDQEMTKDINNNYGIEVLPNLETKFVCANSLIALENDARPLLLSDSDTVKALKEELLNVRKEYFTASSHKKKRTLIKNDKEIIKKLSEELKKRADAFNTDEVEKIAQWSPYNQDSPASFFDPNTMFCVDKFDIVIGNPPYGAKISESDKTYYKTHYEACKTENGVKGSQDTFAVFINRGLNLLNKDGVLSYIVPMAFTSSDAMGALHRKIFRECRKMYVASLGDRPKQIFASAHTCVSLVSCVKTLSPMKELFTTKTIRRSEGVTLKEVIASIRFVNSYKLKLQGRLGRIGSKTGVSVFNKLFRAEKTLASYKVDNANKTKGFLYYRTAGGLYYKTITTYSTGSTQEKGIKVKHNKILVSFLSSSLFWYYWDVYGDGLHLKQYEIDNFPLPDIDKLPTTIKKNIETLCNEYLTDIEKNVNVRTSSANSTYKVKTFKEYKLRKSKALIDKIDDIICPLYGLTKEETTFIKNYEIEYRLDKDD